MMRFGTCTILSSLARKHITEHHLALQGGDREKAGCFSDTLYIGNNLLKSFSDNGYGCLDKHPPLVGREGGDRRAENGSWGMHVLYCFTHVINQNINSNCHCSVAESNSGRGKPG